MNAGTEDALTPGHQYSDQARPLCSTRNLETAPGSVTQK